MKFITLSLALLLTCSMLNAQSAEEPTVSLDNAEYVEWVSTSGFRFLKEIKPGEETYVAADVLDAEGNPIPGNVMPATFNITNYDFNSIVAPPKNIIIKVADNKAIFIYSKQRQEILFKRYLAAQGNN